MERALAYEPKQWFHGEEHQEPGADRPDDPADLLALSPKGDHHAISDETNTDTVGNRVGKRHDDDGEEGWNSNFHLAPLNGGELASHHHTDDDEHWRSCLNWHDLIQRSQKHCGQEQHASGDICQAG